METYGKTKNDGYRWAHEAKQMGFKASGHDGVVSLGKRFEPGDSKEYMVAESGAMSLLSCAPTVTYGSTWGSDSGSVGGHAALTSGDFHMNKSGISKNFVKGVDEYCRNLLTWF
jgi:hypothetical protein